MYPSFPGTAGISSVCLFYQERTFLFAFGMDEDLMLIRRRKSVESPCQYCTSFSSLDFFFFVLTISSARSKVLKNTNIRGLIANLWRLHEDVNWCLNTSCSSGDKWLFCQLNEPKWKAWLIETTFGFDLPLSKAKLNVLCLISFFLDRKTFHQDRIERKEFFNAAKCLGKNGLLWIPLGIIS